MIFICALLICALLNFRHEGRFSMCMMIACTSVWHYALLDSYVGLWYYLSAALVSLFVVLFAAEVRPHTKFARDIIAIELSAIVINAFGALLYQMYWEPDAYSHLMTVLYAVLCLRMIIIRKNDGRAIKVPGFFSFISSYHRYSIK